MCARKRHLFIFIIYFLGASDGIKNLLKQLICTVNGKKPGVMIPIPQYPLYSASLAEFDMGQIGYYLDEAKGWGLDTNELQVCFILCVFCTIITILLQRAYDESKKTYNPRALVVINPGNPTGQVLAKENIEDIIRFAFKNKLFLFADEVYQDNIYAPGSKFYSFKKVMT